MRKCRHESKSRLAMRTMSAPFSKVRLLFLLVFVSSVGLRLTFWNLLFLQGPQSSYIDLSRWYMINIWYLSPLNVNACPKLVTDCNIVSDFCRSSVFKSFASREKHKKLLCFCVWTRETFKVVMLDVKSSWDVFFELHFWRNDGIECTFNNFDWI